ncbi:hypothetical protein BCR33DRAFT_716597 [Rhizoclosmatium globosum]|uniref:Uncharacterized protein n=1 Tax=Rhizoclosmatium globosum TaxID=329046 RepID=A0A1Y2CG77_9FUNG|nr:hypothetical protein BCR33DRAFT_716597 [Rhizoclosmatium globosum]|eukprot:ORY45315.1 hypothetical protein BCR33DRAFT_716597 [Rhizoclosmatium globosum]
MKVLILLAFVCQLTASVPVPALEPRSHNGLPHTDNEGKVDKRNGSPQDYKDNTEKIDWFAAVVFDDFKRDTSESTQEEDRLSGNDIGNEPENTEETMNGIERRDPKHQQTDKAFSKHPKRTAHSAKAHNSNLQPSRTKSHNHTHIVRRGSRSKSKSHTPKSHPTEKAVSKAHKSLQTHGKREEAVTNVTENFQDDGEYSQNNEDIPADILVKTRNLNKKAASTRSGAAQSPKPTRTLTQSRKIHSPAPRRTHSRNHFTSKMTKKGKTSANRGGSRTYRIPGTKTAHSRVTSFTRR